MKKILLIIPYFGKLPNYFELWLKSVSYNKTVNFLLITDDKTQYDYPKNVKVKYTTFKEVQNNIYNLLDFKVKIKEPYKLCDYRPFYNFIFQKEIREFDFWGYCDLDIIFGDIRRFLTDEILDKYSKIYTRGHLTLFKNTQEINEVVKNDKIDYRYRNYKEVFNTNYPCHFDEWGGISRMFECLGISQYDEIDFADLKVKSINFEPLFHKKLSGKRGIFIWNEGKLYFQYDIDKYEEMIYAHFQKRKMENNISNINCNKFIVVPNKFIDYKTIDKEFLIDNTTNNKIYIAYYIGRIKEIIKNIKNGAIGQRIYRLYRKLKRKKNEINN